MQTHLHPLVPLDVAATEEMAEATVEATGTDTFRHQFTPE
jgi:hypothetical protein